MPSNCYHLMMHSHTGYICLNFLHCSGLFSIGCRITLVAFVLLLSTMRFQCTFPSCLPGKMKNYSTMYFQMAWLRKCVVTLLHLFWLLSTKYFQMCPQMACLRGWIVTLVAFVQLRSTVCFKISPQIACPTECIVTLIAFFLPLHCVLSNVPLHLIMHL